MNKTYALSDLPEGTSVVATVRGKENVRGVVYRTHDAFPALFTPAQVQNSRLHPKAMVTNARPLVTLDFADAPMGLGNNYEGWLHQSATRDADYATSGQNHRPAFLRWIAEQIADQTNPVIAPVFTLGQHVHYIGTENDIPVWRTRREDKHLSIVVRLHERGQVTVYDTVENDWWVSPAKHLAPAEVSAK